ncbi:MAG: GatB/YqeY domain-containing protein [Actinomycetota bacterium]
MGSLKERIREETVAAMKGGDKVRVGTLRLLSAAITNREKDARRELTDDEVREVAAKEVKKRNESIEAFEGAGRTELAERERAEREVLADYAPDQLSDADLDALVEAAIASTGATSAKEMGKVMGAVMAQAKGRADGTAVQAKVRARLGG